MQHRDPKTQRGSEKPKEYLSLALYLMFPVSKSASILVESAVLSKCIIPRGASVNENASGSVKEIIYCIALR